MTETRINIEPPPLPRTLWPWWRIALIALLSIPIVLYGLLIVLRLCGLIRPFSIPTSSMSPALIPGDHVMMENISYLGHEPHRGDVVVFKASLGNDLLTPRTFYTKRILGEPGEKLAIVDARLYINDKLVTLSNEAGPISFDLPPSSKGMMLMVTNLTVPPHCYFVVGDNAANSYDSRYFGPIMRKDIFGRIAFRYWPSDRIGEVK